MVQTLAFGLRLRKGGILLVLPLFYFIRNSNQCMKAIKRIKVHIDQKERNTIILICS